MRYIALCIGVVAAAFGIGYYIIGGPRAPQTQSNTVTTPPPAAPVTTQADPHAGTLAAVHPRLKNGDYNAPGAPAIKIVEERTPLLVKSARPPRPGSDSTTDTGSGTINISQQTPPPSDTSASPTPVAASPDHSANGGSPSPPPPPAPADTDYEQGANTHPDTEASQENGGAKASYRVQTGSFAAAKNARVLADALRNRGYVTSTRAEQEGGKTVYKVQIGAYRNKAAADRAAQDLQKDGYPAYSSPIGP